MISESIRNLRDSILLIFPELGRLDLAMVKNSVASATTFDPKRTWLYRRILANGILLHQTATGLDSYVRQMVEIICTPDSEQVGEITITFKPYESETVVFIAKKGLLACSRILESEKRNAYIAFLVHFNCPSASDRSTGITAIDEIFSAKPIETPEPVASENRSIQTSLFKKISNILS